MCLVVPIVLNDETLNFNTLFELHSILQFFVNPMKQYYFIISLDFLVNSAIFSYFTYE